MELLSPMAVMLEGLGFNLCVAPFLNICVLNLSWRVGAEDVGGGQSWVRGVVLELDGRRLKSDCSEDEKLVRINDNIQNSVKYMNGLLFKRLYAAGLA